MRIGLHVVFLALTSNSGVKWQLVGKTTKDRLNGIFFSSGPVRGQRSGSLTFSLLGLQSPYPL